jgi:hypothetical protein
MFDWNGCQRALEELIELSNFAHELKDGEFLHIRFDSGII